MASGPVVLNVPRPVLTIHKPSLKERVTLGRDGKPVFYTEEMSITKTPEFKVKRSQIIEDFIINISGFTRKLYVAKDRVLDSSMIYLDEKGFCCLLSDTNYVDLDTTPGMCLHPKPSKIDDYYRLYYGTTDKDIYFLKVYQPKTLTFELISSSIPKIRSSDSFSVIRTDEFTNDWLIGFYLWEKHPDLRQYLMEYLAANICRRPTSAIFEIFLSGYNNSLYNINEPYYFEPLQITDSDIKEGSMIVTIMKPEIIATILGQIISYLNEADKIGLYHNNLTSRSVYYERNDLEYKISGSSCPSTILIKVGDFARAGIKIKLDDKLYIIQRGDIKLSETEVRYKSNIPYFDLSRMSNLPGNSALDFYTFMVSFISLPTVFNCIFNNPRSELKYTIWDKLWFPRDASVIYTRITQLVMVIKEGKLISHQDCIDVLKGAMLKRNILDEMKDLVVCQS